jgi:hypothetical protein
MSKWIIADWAGNICFFSQEFDSFEEADEFLTLFIEREFSDSMHDEELFFEIKCDYFIELKGRVRESKYLSPNDTRACLKNERNM